MLFRSTALKSDGIAFALGIRGCGMKKCLFFDGNQVEIGRHSNQKFYRDLSRFRSIAFRTYGGKMLKMPKLLWALIAMSALISQTEALAEDTAAGTSTADNKSWAEKHLKATYLFSASGMHTEALSGNRDGTGTSLGFDHFFAAGGKQIGRAHV